MSALEKLYGDRVWREDALKKPTLWKEIPKEKIAQSADLLLEDVRMTERALITRGMAMPLDIKEDLVRRAKLANDMKAYSFVI